jgi:hypothetical protein
VITYHPGIKRLVFTPAPELKLLRQQQLPTIASGTSLPPNVSVAVNSSVWPSSFTGDAAEIRVKWKRPKTAARLSISGASLGECSKCSSKCSSKVQQQVRQQVQQRHVFTRPDHF